MIRKMLDLMKPFKLPTSASLAMLFLRLAAGSAFVLHGWGKIQNPMGWMPEQAPVPGVFQLLAAVAEFGGGIAWILGLVTPLASAGLVVTMFVAAMMHFLVLHDPFVAMTGGSSAEPAVSYFVIALVLLTVGPGRFSIDQKIFGSRSN